MNTVKWLISVNKQVLVQILESIWLAVGKIGETNGMLDENASDEGGGWSRLIGVELTIEKMGGAGLKAIGSSMKSNGSVLRR